MSSKVTEKLKLIMKPAYDGPGGAVSLDVWTDDFKRNAYLCLVAHFIDDNFVLHNRVIANEVLSEDRRKDGPYILEKTEEILLKYGITDMMKIVFVSDRGSNMRNGLKDLSHIFCALHFLNNCLQHIFKSGQPKMLLETCRKIIRFVKKSGKNGKFEPSLKSPSNIRWNFALKMFASLVENDNWNTLCEMLNGSPQKRWLERIEKTDILYLIRFLTIFDRATKSMESTAKPTIHNVIAWYTAIEKHLQRSETDPEIIRIAKDNVEAYFLLTKLEDGEYLESIYHKICIFMHPAMKKMTKMTPEEKSEVRTEIKRQCQRMNMFLVAPGADENRPDRVSIQNISFDILADYMGLEPNEPTGGSDVNEEIALYEDAEDECLSADVLKWWATNAGRFPRLSLLARYVFCIPASSAAPERNFSSAGFIMSERRSSLSPSTVEEILICHSNYDLIQETADGN